MSNQIFYDSKEEVSIRLLDSGNTYVSNKFDTMWRILPHAVLTTIVAGPGEAAGTSLLEFPDSSSRLFRPNTTVLIPRNTRHRFSNTRLPHTAVWLHWDVSIMADLDIFGFFEIPDEITGEASRRIAGLCREIHECGRADLLASIRQKTLLYNVLAEVLANCRPKYDYQTFCSRGAEFLPLLDYIDRHLGERMPLGKLAKKQSCSVSALQQKFSAAFGASPGDFVIRRRLLRATRLLCSTQNTLDEIAAEVGFSDAFCLSKSFKAHLGISPREYRKFYRNRS